MECEEGILVTPLYKLGQRLYGLGTCYSNELERRFADEILIEVFKVIRARVSSSHDNDILFIPYCDSSIFQGLYTLG